MLESDRPKQDYDFKTEDPLLRLMLPYMLVFMGQQTLFFHINQLSTTDVAITPPDALSELIGLVLQKDSASAITKTKIICFAYHIK